MAGLGRALVLLAALAAPAAAAAESIDVGLSTNLVSITTGFAGTTVPLFGTVDGEGDIIVTVTGPRSEMVVRRKGQVNGVWINRQSMTFDNVPGFYSVAATRALEVILQAQVRQREEIGNQYLRLAPRENLPPQDMILFRQALIRNMERQSLFQPQVGTIRFPGARLFRADLHLPANVPTGAYNVRVFLAREGQVIASTTITLPVTKSGVSAEIYEYAQFRSWYYGVAAVLLAAFAGFAAYRLFQRR
jgi:uncharacterized protein (TIGR02186 family)